MQLTYGIEPQANVPMTYGAGRASDTAGSSRLTTIGMFVIVLLGVMLGITPATTFAQGRAPSYLLRNIPDSVRRKHMLQVSPHLLVLSPDRRSATLEFTNSGDKPVSANIAIQLGFTIWQNTDTSFTPTPGKSLRGHDTVIVHSKPSDRYAGDWITGVPSYMTLNPHETRRVTLRIDPPATIPAGEYYARIVTMVGSRVKRGAVSSDTGNTGAVMFPVNGWELPVLRDSVRVFFRKGPQTMGLEITKAEAEIDTADGPIEDVGPHPLRMLLRIKNTGIAHFEGQIEMSFLDANHDEVYLLGSEGAAFTMHRDGIMRWSAETDHLPPGTYHVRIQFSAKQDEFALADRIPMKRVSVEVPFTVPEYATGVEAMPAISTGQESRGATDDRYWRHINGPIDYHDGDALTRRGNPAVILSGAGGAVFGAWAMRSMSPEMNLNNGWIGSSDNTTTSAPIGHNILRIFVDLSNRKLLAKHLAGMFWADDCAEAIFVNGEELASFSGKNQCFGERSWQEGFPFSIGADDGLIDGVNVIDFMYNKTDDAWDGIRVDFRMIFRETNDK